MLSSHRRMLRRVRFELTVAAPAGERDVAITAPDDAPPDALRRAVADAAALSGLTPALDLARQPRTGAVLAAGSDVEPPDGPRLSVVVVAGRCTGTVRPLRPGRFVIGRAPDCDFVLEDTSVSRRHVELDVGRRCVTVRDLASTNGARLDGNPLEGLTEWRPGQLLELGNSVVGIWQASRQQRAAVLTRGDVVIVNRSPRPVPPPTGDAIDLPGGPAASPTRQRIALAGALVPAVLGAVIAWWTGSVQFLFFSALTPVMLLSTACGERLQWRRSRRRAAAARRRALDAARTNIAQALDAERDHLRVAAPHPNEIALIAAAPSPRLWERGLDDPDFLSLRLGTAALPSRVVTRCDGSESAAGTLSAAPVCVDLRTGPLGLCGPPEVTRAVGRWLLTQLATLHSPTVVTVALVLPNSDEPWHWARWLPHLGPRVATDPEAAAALVPELSRRTGDPPVLVTLVDGTTPQGGPVPGLGARSPVIYLTRGPEAVPARCAHVVTVLDPGSSRATLRSGNTPGSEQLEFALDQVSAEWADAVARSLAPLSDEAGSAFPGAMSGPSPSLCELSGAGAPDPALIRALWQRGGRRPRTVVGISEDGPLWIDLAADGPHCLVAGTTGAGKSEFLRTLVTGLAIACPPSAVSFVLIDYKGGAAFAACAELPHTAGVVTDLDAQLTGRALRALHAELRRRERLLADAGVADIDGLHRSRPDLLVPRLVVVVDEFAALADELPDFLRGLVGVAQRGRSLGLHLVLATQRPGRAVTPEIKANTSLRVALRVTDVAESLDVIDSPLAAAIAPGRPGTGFLRAGERCTAFRAARPAPPPAPDITVELLGRWRRPLDRPVDADAEANLRTVVATVAAAARLCGAAPAARPWLPPLPARIPDPGGPDGAAEIALGMVDLPDQQRQDVLRIDLAAPAPLLACGTAGSGRTGLLLGVALRAGRQLPPTQLEIYVIERGAELRSALAPLPHVASAVSAADDPGLVGTLLRRLAATSAESSDGGGPVLRLLLVDDWDAVLAAADDGAAAQLNDAFATLVRTAADRRLTVLVTGDRPTLAARWSAAVGTRLLLRLADRADYALAGIAARDVPAFLPPGRGLRGEDGAEVQLFVPPPACGPATADAVAIGRRWANLARRGSAVRIRQLPERVEADSCLLPPVGLRVGVGGDSAATLALDPFGSGPLLVAGPPRSGRSTALLTILAECLRVGVDVAVAAPRTSPLWARAAQLRLRVIACDTDDDTLDPPAAGPTLLLVDDCEAFDDTAAGDRVAQRLRRRDPRLGAVVAGRTDELASAYRGIGADARRNRSGLLLRPAPIDGELFGVRLPRTGAAAPAGRGVLVGVRCWSAGEPGQSPWLPVDTGDPVPVQVAVTGSSGASADQPPAMWGYR